MSNASTDSEVCSVKEKLVEKEKESKGKKDTFLQKGLEDLEIQRC